MDIHDKTKEELLRDLLALQQKYDSLKSSFETNIDKIQQNRWLRLNAILESIDTPIFSLDTQYRYTYFNSVHATIMKVIYNVDIEIGQSLAKYQTVEDWQLAKINLDRALKGECFLDSASSGDEVHSKRYFEVAHHPLKSNTGEIIGVSVFVRDTTQRKLAEEALQKSQALLNKTSKIVKASAGFIESTADAPDYQKITDLMVDISGAQYATFNIFDDYGRDFTTVALSGMNQNIEKGLSILGFNVINKHWDYDPMREEKIRPQIITRFETLHELTANNIAEVDILLIEKTFNIGHVFIVKISKDDKFLGDFTLMFTKGENITNKHFVELYAQQVGMFLDKKRMEDVLRNSEAKHKEMIANISDVIAIMDKNGTIRYKSPNIEKWFGWLPEDLVGKDGWVTVHPDDLQRLQLIFSDLLDKDNSVRTLEYNYKCKDGSYKFIELTAKNLTDDPFIHGVLMNYHDITERKQVEKALQKSEQQYRMLFENMLDGYAYCQMLFDDRNEPLDFIYLSVNNAFEQLTGLKDVVGKRVLELIPDIKELSPELFESYGRVAMTGKPEKFEFDFKSLNMWLSISVYSPDKGYFVAVFQNITESKHALEALKESNEFNKSLIKAIPFGIDIVDEEGNIIFQNETLQGIFGEKAIGNKCWELYRDDKLQCKGCPLRVGIKIGETYTYEARGVLGGNIFEISHTGIIFRGKKALLEIFQNITERKQAEVALKNSMSLIEAILESSNNGILVMNSEGNIIRTNEKFAEMWGIPENITVSGDDRKMLNFMMGQLSDPDDCIAKTKKLYIDPNAESHDVLYFKNGRIFERVSKPMLIAFQPKGRVWSFRDITERVQTESVIKRKNEELLELNATKDKFFSIIAHDLKNPFSGILGLTEILIENIDKKDKENTVQLAKLINNSASITFKLLENLLEWSRIQTGMIKPKFQKCNLKTILDNIVMLYSEMANSKDITLQNDTIIDTLIYADENMTKTVLRNLISNAIKFTVNDGLVSISAQQNDSSIVIQVTDSGVGIPPDRIKYLFSIERNVSTKSTTGERGTGLGLLLCKDLVEKQGGKIWVESEVGKGSTFYFTLKQAES